MHLHAICSTTQWCSSQWCAGRLRNLIPIGPTTNEKGWIHIGCAAGLTRGSG